VPLVHIAKITRSLTYGDIGLDLVWSLLWILGVTALFFLIAINLMKRRLIV
jgi:lipooligosaccharide transport system permease protein